MNPAGTLATGTITMPAAPADGMTISFSSTQAITALTVAGNTGQSIVGQPTVFGAGAAVTFVYRLSNTTWYTQTNTASSSTGVPVMNVFTTPGTWTKPGTVKAIKVTVVGGGAPGSTVSGGGAGGTSINTYSAPALPGPQPYTVGGVSAASSFGVSPATVLSATAGAVTSGGGAGGAGSGGQLNIGGGNGTGASPSLTPSSTGGGSAGGSGGSSIFGGNGGGGSGGPTGPGVPGFPGTPGSAGKAATGYGSGGGGGGGGGSSSSGVGSSGAAAAGLQGVVIVEEFY
jgi:hypothetical protein